MAYRKRGDLMPNDIRFNGAGNLLADYLASMQGLTDTINPNIAEFMSLNQLTGTNLIKESDMHIYSLDEHVIGKWIDGQDVYERTYVFTEETYQSHKVYDIASDFDDTCTLVDFTAIIRFSPDGQTLYTSNNYFAGYTASTVSHAVIEFGKSSVSGDMVANIVVDVPHVWQYQEVIATVRYIKNS